MMTVDTYVGPSAIEGVGIFAAEPIPAGTLIWRYDPRFDRFLCRSELANADAYLLTYLEKYSYPHHEDPDLLVIEIDNGRFMNHSGTPNTDFTGQTEGYALADIAAGQEITCDYSEFDPIYTLLPSRVAAFSQSKTNGAGAA